MLDFLSTMGIALAVSTALFFLLVPVALLIDSLLPYTRRDIERDILGSYVFVAVAANLAIAVLHAADSPLLERLTAAGAVVLLIGGALVSFGGGFAAGRIYARSRMRPPTPPPHVPTPQREGSPRSLGELIPPGLPKDKP